MMAVPLADKAHRVAVVDIPVRLAMPMKVADEDDSI